MTVKSFLIAVIREINPTNLNKVMDAFSNGMKEFGSSMDKITQELGESKKESTQDRVNVDKLLGKKKPLW